jgi:hypothetical protein
MNWWVWATAVVVVCGVAGLWMLRDHDRDEENKKKKDKGPGMSLADFDDNELLLPPEQSTARSLQPRELTYNYSGSLTPVARLSSPSRAFVAEYKRATTPYAVLLAISSRLRRMGLDLDRLLETPITRLPVHVGLLRSAPQVMSSLTFMVLGSGVGAEMRRLTMDGALDRNVFGVEPDSELSQAGCELFEDATAMRGRVVEELSVWFPDSDNKTASHAPPPLFDVIYCSFPLNEMSKRKRVEIIRRARTILGMKTTGLTLFMGHSPCSLR